jgi:hypothetical protein
MYIQPTNTPNLIQNTYLIQYIDSIQDITLIQRINSIQNIESAQNLDFTLKTKCIHNNAQNIIPTQNKKPNPTQNLIHYLKNISTYA